MKRIVFAFGLAAALAACAPSREAQDNLAAGQAFLAGNAAKPGVVSLPDGLQYKIVASGPAGGAYPKATDAVRVHYEGRLLSGQVFDSSIARGTPADLPLQNLIPAWTEALQRMRPGDEWTLYVPPGLGYGERGAGPIPPNSVLVFDIRLIKDLGPAQPQ